MNPHNTALTAREPAGKGKNSSPANVNRRKTLTARLERKMLTKVTAVFSSSAKFSAIPTHGSM